MRERCVQTSESVRIVRSAALPEVELLVIDHSARPWRVYHEGYTLAAARVTCRVAEFWYRGKYYSADPDVAAVMEPGEMHVTNRVYAPASLTAVEVQASFVASAAREMGLGSALHIRTPQCPLPQLNHALLAFCESVDQKASSLEQKTRLYECLAFAFRHCGENAPPRLCQDARKARIAREYLHEHFAEQVTLDEVANVSGLSRYHLVRSFRRFYGVPPHAYQNALRIAAARKAIQAGIPLADIDVGFADQSHMSRFFKRTLSLTPGRYAAQQRDGCPRIRHLRDSTPLRVGPILMSPFR